VSQVVAIVPAFLQRPPAWPLRVPALVAPRLRRASRQALATQVVSAAELSEAGWSALDGALEDLRNPRVARHTAAALAWAARRTARARAVAALEALAVPYRLVVGSEDPLQAPRGDTVTIAGAGHHLHVTHPEELARVIREALRTEAGTEGRGRGEMAAAPRARAAQAISSS
jgi:pimeloyl-ACP methyl ester carboxylesterase